MLKLQYFGHLMGRADSLEKTLMLGNSLYVEPFISSLFPSKSECSLTLTFE